LSLAQKALDRLKADEPAVPPTILREGPQQTLPEQIGEATNRPVAAAPIREVPDLPPPVVIAAPPQLNPSIGQGNERQIPETSGRRRVQVSDHPVPPADIPEGSD
jgi:hypothetical protein